MALYYNLEKAHQKFESDNTLIFNTINSFVVSIPKKIKNLKIAIRSKNHDEVYKIAKTIKPKIDLMGMNLTFDEIILIENWAQSKGKKKEIMEVFKSTKSHLKAAVTEIIEDFKIA